MYLSDDLDHNDLLLVRALELTRGMDEGWLYGLLQAELAGRRSFTDLDSSLHLYLDTIQHEHRSGSRLHLIAGMIGAARFALPRVERFEMAVVSDEFAQRAQIANPMYRRGVQRAEERLGPERVAELRGRARVMSFSDFADYARSEIETALAELAS